MSFLTYSLQHLCLQNKHVQFEEGKPFSVSPKSSRATSRKSPAIFLCRPSLYWEVRWSGDCTAAVMSLPPKHFSSCWQWVDNLNGYTHQERGVTAQCIWVFHMSTPRRLHPPEAEAEQDGEGRPSAWSSRALNFPAMTPETGKCTSTREGHRAMITVRGLFSVWPTYCLEEGLNPKRRLTFRQADGALVGHKDS